MARQRSGETMRVFIAWSGRDSLASAELLQRWVQDVLQVRAWLSTTGIRRGGRWFYELTAALEDTSVGIACLTRQNVESPWINFEMGAVANRLGGSSVVPFLLDDVDLDEVRSPLSQFQAVRRDYREVFEFLRSMRDTGNLAIDDDELRRRHDATWPDLLTALESAVVQRRVGHQVDDGTIRCSLDRDDDGTYLAVTSIGDYPVYVLRWTLPNDRGEWDIPPHEVTIDGNSTTYPLGVLRPGQTVRVPVTRRSPIEIPLHIRFEWHDSPDRGQMRQLECWLES